MSNKPVSGIPFSDQDSLGQNSDFHKKLCKAIVPYYGDGTPLIEMQDSMLNSLLGLCVTIQSIVIACNADDEFQIRPDAMVGFLDSFICQIEALKVINHALWKEIISLKREAGK